MRALLPVLLLLACAPKDSDMRTPPSQPPRQDDLRARLSPLAYHVTQECGTEPAFDNAYWDNHEPGIYVDVVSGEALFSSTDKFDSGTGWPSFTRPIAAGRVSTSVDASHGLERTEVKSAGAGSHLGHVFDDGPAEAGGLRYCINSAALRFVPASRLAAEGYAEHLPLFAPSGDRETALLAGGCFWGMEELLRGLPGVVDTDVGYTGGRTASPSYTSVKSGATGHAEAVRVVFDPARLSYAELLRFYFRIHDPTTPNRQGNDVGTQYRSAIFVSGPEQRAVAEAVRGEVDASGKWPRPVVTVIVPAGAFTPAEDYHQDYLQKHPDGYSCHYVRE